MARLVQFLNKGAMGFLNCSSVLACLFWTPWHPNPYRGYPSARLVIPTCWPFPWQWWHRTPGAKNEHGKSWDALDQFDLHLVFPKVSTLCCAAWLMFLLFVRSPLHGESLLLGRQQAAQFLFQASFSEAMHHMRPIDIDFYLYMLVTNISIYKNIEKIQIYVSMCLGIVGMQVRRCVDYVGT